MLLPYSAKQIFTKREDGAHVLNCCALVTGSHSIESLYRFFNLTEEHIKQIASAELKVERAERYNPEEKLNDIYARTVAPLIKAAREAANNETDPIRKAAAFYNVLQEAEFVVNKSTTTELGEYAQVMLGRVLGNDINHGPSKWKFFQLNLGEKGLTENERKWIPVGGREEKTESMQEIMAMAKHLRRVKRGY